MGSTKGLSAATKKRMSFQVRYQQVGRAARSYEAAQAALAASSTSASAAASASHGSGFGHLAVAVPDIYGACEKMKADGVSTLIISLSPCAFSTTEICSVVRFRKNFNFCTSVQ